MNTLPELDVIESQMRRLDRCVDAWRRFRRHAAALPPELLPNLYTAIRQLEFAPTGDLTGWTIAQCACQILLERNNHPTQIGVIVDTAVARGYRSAYKRAASGQQLRDSFTVTLMRLKDVFRHLGKGHWELVAPATMTPAAGTNGNGHGDAR